MAEQYISSHEGLVIDQAVDLALTADQFTAGYYDATADKFYSDSSKTIEITGDSKNIYLDITDTNKLLPYYFTGAGYKPMGGVGGVIARDISQEEFDALPQEEKDNGTIYFIQD